MGLLDNVSRFHNFMRSKGYNKSKGNEASAYITYNKTCKSLKKRIRQYIKDNELIEYQRNWLYTLEQRLDKMPMEKLNSLYESDIEDSFIEIFKVPMKNYFHNKK